MLLLLLGLIGAPLLLGLSDLAEGPADSPAESLKEGPILVWLALCSGAILWAVLNVLR